MQVGNKGGEISAQYGEHFESDGKDIVHSKGYTD